MSAEGADQVRILDLFVEVADEATAGQVGRCNFVERADFLFAGGGIIYYDRTGKSGGKEHLLDGNIVFLLRNQRKEFIEWLVLISLEYFLCDRVQWHTDTVTGRSSLVLRGIYSTPPLITFALVSL